MFENIVDPYFFDAFDAFDESNWFKIFIVICRIFSATFTLLRPSK